MEIIGDLSQGHFREGRSGWEVSNKIWRMGKCLRVAGKGRKMWAVTGRGK